MRGLEQDVCTGNQTLVGRNPAVADRARALARLTAGRPLIEGDPGRDAVVVLQRALVMLGFSTSKSPGHTDGAAVIDGVFGPGTARGLGQFQRESALEPTSALELRTLAALDGAIAARLAAMDTDERARQRDVLDRTIHITAADMKRLYRQALAQAAEVSNVKEEVVAAIVLVESAGGAANRPKFESHHLVALKDMHDVLTGESIEGATAEAIDVLATRASSVPLRPGENGVTTRLSRSLLRRMADSTTSEGLRAALATIQRWTPTDLRELATSWGWGQIMGWHTLRPAFARAGIELEGLKSHRPALQIAMLGRALAVETAWRDAARAANVAGDYAAFAAAYNGAAPGTPKNAKYAAAMRQAAAEYRIA
jgi:hypothetical protein